MSLFKKVKHFATQPLSIIIVPHTGESIRQIKFNKMIFCFFIALISSMCVSLFFLIYVLTNLNHQLDNKLKDLSALQTINAQQQQEIHELKSKANLVSEKLSVLNELEIQVRNLVGLNKVNSSSSSTKPISRSIMRKNFAAEDKLSNISADSITIENAADLVILASKMDKEMENLNDLINEVTDQLKVLDAKPDKMPTIGKITSKFGYRKSPFDGKRQFHAGLDIANAPGTKIYAAGTGIVTFSGWRSGYGKTIIISHGYGYRSVYAHNKENLVKVGQKVKKGEMIAKMGSTGKSTGTHLHFEIHYRGKQIDPLSILK